MCFRFYMSGEEGNCMTQDDLYFLMPFTAGSNEANLFCGGEACYLCGSRVVNEYECPDDYTFDNQYCGNSIDDIYEEFGTDIGQICTDQSGADQLNAIFN